MTFRIPKFKHRSQGPKSTGRKNHIGRKVKKDIRANLEEESAPPLKFRIGKIKHG